MSTSSDPVGHLFEVDVPIVRLPGNYQEIEPEPPQEEVIESASIFDGDDTLNPFGFRRITVSLPAPPASVPEVMSDHLGDGNSTFSLGVWDGRTHTPSPYPGPRIRAPDRKTLGFRLRRRGLLTRRMETVISQATLGHFNPGGQTSGFNVATWLGLIGGSSGVKVIRGHRVLYDHGAGKSPEEDWHLTVCTGGSEILLSLAIYVKLATYATFRERTLPLIQSLRTRAVQYGKELDMPMQSLAMVLPGTVSLAMQILDHEMCAWDSMGGPAGRRTNTIGEEYRCGETATKYNRGWKLATWIAGGRERGRKFPSAQG